MDELAIARVLAEYCQFVDDGRFDEVVDRFTPDGRFVFGAREAVGRDSVRSFLIESQPPERRGKHITTNVVIDVDGDRATATADFLFLTESDGTFVVRLAGRYHDELRRIGGAWRIHRRDARLL